MNDAVLVQVTGGEEALAAGAAHAGGAVQPQVRLQVLRARYTCRVIQRSSSQIIGLTGFIRESGSGLLLNLDPDPYSGPDFFMTSH